LDNVITSTLSFEGDGRVREYVGGYDDWLRQSSQSTPQRTIKAPKEEALPSVSEPPRKRRLSYKEQRELDALPQRIEALETEQRELQATIAGPDFDKETADAINQALVRADALQQELTQAYARWEELDSRAIQN